MKQTHEEMNIFDLSHQGYDASEPKKIGKLSPIYGLMERNRPKPIEQELAFFTDTSICSGCKACEVACKQWNQIKTTDFTWSGNSYDNTKRLNDENWRHVKFIERFDSENNVDRPAPDSLEGILNEPKIGNWLLQSDQCKHCQQSPCHEACPTGAIMRNEFGGIYYQTDICMGCNMCVAACPFGVPKVSEKYGHSMKCSECYDRLRDGLKPACATTCTTGAINFGPREEMEKLAWKRLIFLHENGHPEARLYGADHFKEYSPLNSFYLLMDEPAVYGLPDEPVRPTTHMIWDYLKAVAAFVVCAGILVATTIVAIP